MGVAQSDIDATLELFAPLGELRTRRMMGGLCLYHRDTIFAILRSDGQILIKGGDGFGATLEARGGTRWVYTRKTGKAGVMPYWTLPDDCLDDPDAAVALAREAFAHL
ncbi:TfoX/Sxy family protein [Cognatishimia sp. F0-27]|uniref:TfoX/Sxy family protein n=1 Tax=Cognatishimia sp. F0-27 TaxID=2816855 RepID=UPI001D0C378C|nr:TfoX/Sxy family protein [Cognatishimia sp. F0-27]MCC1492355.1 TfoX/Sxy family protein [Cognatishimia sp. F0-27]